MSLKLTYRKTRPRNKKKPGVSYIEGTDHKGERVHERLFTSDRDLAKTLFAKKVAESTAARG